MLIGINLIHNNSVKKKPIKISDRDTVLLVQSPAPPSPNYGTLLYLFLYHQISYLFTPTQLSCLYSHQLNTSSFSVKIKAITKEYTPSHRHTFLLTGI